MARLGIDIGGTAVKAALIGNDGSVRTAVSRHYTRPDRAALRAAVAEAVASLGEHGAGSVGLCLPGRRAASGECVELAVNAPGLEGWAFADLVRHAAGADLPFRVCSDAEAATIDATAAHPDHRRVLGVAIGTGVGATLIEDARPVRIGAGSGGHLGQIDVGPIGDGPDPIGPDGGRNTLEAYLGVPALTARFGPELGPALADLPENDPAFLALVRAIRIALAIYTPTLVLLLGGVGIALAGRAEAIDRAVRTDLTRVAPAGWRLAFGTSRFHAAIGAARLGGNPNVK